MNISEETLESAVNDLVDKLEKDKDAGNIKLMNDDLFNVDADENFESDFNIGEPKKKEEPKITYIWCSLTKTNFQLELWITVECMSSVAAMNKAT